MSEEEIDLRSLIGLLATRFDTFALRFDSIAARFDSVQEKVGTVESELALGRREREALRAHMAAAQIDKQDPRGAKDYGKPHNGREANGRPYAPH